MSAENHRLRLKHCSSSNRLLEYFVMGLFFLLFYFECERVFWFRTILSHSRIRYPDNKTSLNASRPLTYIKGEEDISKRSFMKVSFVKIPNQNEFCGDI